MTLLHAFRCFIHAKKQRIILQNVLKRLFRGCKALFEKRIAIRGKDNGLCAFRDRLNADSLVRYGETVNSRMPIDTSCRVILEDLLPLQEGENECASRVVAT